MSKTDVNEKIIFSEVQTRLGCQNERAIDNFRVASCPVETGGISILALQVTEVTNDLLRKSDVPFVARRDCLELQRRQHDTLFPYS